MFGHRYYGRRHFGPRYFGDGGSGTPVVPPAAATPIPGSGGGYHFHPKDPALDWRVRDKNELERILAELGENPETREQVAEIRAAHAKPVSKAEAKKPPEKRKPPEFDIARLMRDMNDTYWLLKTYDALMLRQLEMKRRDEDDATFMLLM